MREKKGVLGGTCLWWEKARMLGGFIRTEIPYLVRVYVFDACKYDYYVICAIYAAYAIYAIFASHADGTSI